MADTPNEPTNGAPTEDIDTGEPIAALAELREDPSRGFLAGIRRRLQRRALVEDVGEFSWLGLSPASMPQDFPARRRAGDQG